MRPLMSSPAVKKIIAVEFDGTLVHNIYPTISNPNLALIDFIKAYRNDFVWILWTCRSGSRLSDAVTYMKMKHGIEFDYVNENTTENIDAWGDTRKIAADYYIDDKICDTQRIIKEIRNNA